jgi:hypothetical protein
MDEGEPALLFELAGMGEASSNISPWSTIVARALPFA